MDDTRAIIAALVRRFSDVVGPECATSATRRRTDRPPCANCASVADVIIVVGARNSSNSNRLREIGDEAGIPSYLVADSSEIDPGMGAATPRSSA